MPGDRAVLMYRFLLFGSLPLHVKEHSSHLIHAKRLGVKGDMEVLGCLGRQVQY